MTMEEKRLEEQGDPPFKEWRPTTEEIGEAITWEPGYIRGRDMLGDRIRGQARLNLARYETAYFVSRLIHRLIAMVREAHPGTLPMEVKAHLEWAEKLLNRAEVLQVLPRTYINRSSPGADKWGAV